MGFIEPRPVNRPHYCDRPEPPSAYPVGTRWQCDECGKIYRVDSVFDRNISSVEWVHEPAE